MREYLMLANTFNRDKDNPASMMVSVKLDGQRALWDGGASRGKLKSSIPWANTAKDSRYRFEPYATGLWSRYGNVIHAPPWFLDQLPVGQLLDGELFLGRRKFQETRKIISTLEPTTAWEGITYYVFDTPKPQELFASGTINNQNCKLYIDERKCMEFFTDALAFPRDHLFRPTMFQTTYNAILDLWMRQHKPSHWKPLKQTLLPPERDRASVALVEELEKEERLGGEGLVLRNPFSFWEPKRTSMLLKVKTFADLEVKVVGYVTGRDTDKGGRLRGSLGALIVELESGKRFQVSGFTDQERILVTSGDDKRQALEQARKWAYDHPEEECPDWISAVTFPRGCEITIKHRDFTDDGLPREARYWRK